MRGSELVRDTAKFACSVAGAAIIVASTPSCAAVPAARQTHAAQRALDTEQRRHLREPTHAAEHTYQLILAAALLDKAREQAAKGRFESARDLAYEAAQLARAVHASRAASGGGV